MQGMTKTPYELFAMLKSAEVEIKKEHVVFMVKKTTEFKRSRRRDKGKKGNPKKDGKSVVIPPKAPKQSPELSASTARVKVTGNATAPST